jgi:hypothetical protein
MDESSWSKSCHGVEAVQPAACPYSEQITTWRCYPYNTALSKVPHLLLRSYVPSRVARTLVLCGDRDRRILRLRL